MLTTFSFTLAFLPLSLVAVMVTVPALTPVTLPVLLTLAIFLLLLFQVTLSVLLAGVSTALSCSALPTFTRLVGAVTRTFVAGMLTTFTFTLAFLPL